MVKKRKSNVIVYGILIIGVFALVLFLSKSTQPYAIKDAQELITHPQTVEQERVLQQEERNEEWATKVSAPPQDVTLHEIFSEENEITCAQLPQQIRIMVKC